MNWAGIFSSYMYQPNRWQGWWKWKHCLQTHTLGSLTYNATKYVGFLLVKLRNYSWKWHLLDRYQKVLFHENNYWRFVINWTAKEICHFCQRPHNHNKNLPDVKMYFWIAIYINTLPRFKHLNSLFLKMNYFTDLLRCPQWNYCISRMQYPVSIFFSPKLSWKNSHLGNSNKSILNFRPRRVPLMCRVTIISMGQIFMCGLQQKRQVSFAVQFKSCILWFTIVSPSILNSSCDCETCTPLER